MKKSKKIIISIIAVILVASITIGIVFCVRRNSGGTQVSGGTGTETIDPIFTNNENITYETAEYNGYTVPAEILSYLKDGDKAAKEACLKYGIAMKVGNHEISTIEFGMAYFDLYATIAGESATNEAPANTEIPSGQAYGEGTWSDEIRKQVADDLRNRYLLFDEALKNGFLPSDEQLKAILYDGSFVEGQASNERITPDKSIEKNYFEGANFGIYIHNMILLEYFNCYTEALKSGFGDSHTLDEIDTEYHNNEDAYNYVDALIYFFDTMSDDVAEEARQKVKNKEDFYNFAYDYSKLVYSDYKGYVEANCVFFNCLHETFSTKFGSEVADWCFESQRKEGDITVIKGAAAYCLIYIERPSYTLTTVNYHEIYSFFNLSFTDPTDDDVKAAKERIEKAKSELEETDCSQKAFEELAVNYSQGVILYEEAEGKCVGYHINELVRNQAQWLYDPERKPGDLKILNVGYGYGLFMFDSLNEGDWDYRKYVRINLAQKDYDNYLQSLIDYKDNAVTIYSKQQNKAVDYGEIACKVFSDKKIERASQENQNQQ